MSFKNFLSLERKSLKYKIVIAFSLMSVIPLLILVFVVSNYIFPNTENIAQVSLIVVFTLWVSWMGYLLIKQIITPILDLSLETRIIAEGKYGSKITVTKGDELGDIAETVNTMTGRIKSDISELQDYSKKTATLNMRIHKKVLTLTNLMRLGDLISTGASFEEITSFAAEKMAGEMDKGYCIIYTKEGTGAYPLKTFYNSSRKDIPTEELAKELPLMEKLFAKSECLYIDSRPLTKPWQKEFKGKFALGHVVFFPMKDGAKSVGVIVAGNFSDDYQFDNDEVGVVRAYEKELIMGYQSSQVFEKVKSLEVVDSLTGLYTRAYLEDRLEDEINRAVYYQRPCSVLVINVDDFDKYAERYGVAKSKLVLRQISQLLSDMASPVGKVARFDYDEFAMLLPEKNKRESIEIAESVCSRIFAMEISGDPNDRVGVSIGVGENPIDGVNAKEIIAKAYHNMEKAKTHGKNRVVGQ